MQGLHPSSRSLLVGAAWAVAAAMAGRECGLVAGCGVAGAALLVTLWRCRAGAWIWALPAAFAGAASHAELHGSRALVRWPEAGPVRFAGVVQPGVRVDPRRGDCSFRLVDNRQEFLCVVASPSSGFRVLPGDRVRGLGRLPAQAERRRDGGLPRVTTSEDALQIETGGFGPRRLAASCRLLMQESLLRLVPGDPGVLLCHLVLGSGPQLAGHLLRAHRATGLSHLLAVSGAHLTMLGWLLGFAFAATTRRSPLLSPRFRRVCIAVLVFYGLVTGMQPPVFRAVVAMLVFLVGTGRGRRVPLAAVLALPAMLTAVLAPADLFGVSFNLSYAAVIGLALSGGLGGRTFTRRFVVGPLQCSLWATLCTMPLTLWYFGQFAPWSLVATPLLGPVVAVMLGLGLLAAAAAPVLPWLAAGLAWPLHGITQGYCAAVAAIGDLPLAPVHANLRPEPAALAVALLCGAAALLNLRDRRGIAVLCTCLSLPHFLPAPAAGPARLQLLAVGHGQAALLELPDGAAALVDCGSLGAVDRASRAVARALLPRRSLDLLILTHGDADHVGDVVGLLERVRVRRAVLPVEMRGGPVAAALREADCAVSWIGDGGVNRPHDDLVVQRPVSGTSNRNDGSAWVRARLGSFQALLCGDAMEAGTAAWLRSDLAATADVLVLPHHGRANREAARLLARVRPRLALVSSALGDGISAQGHAAAALGCPVLHTGLVGTVTVCATTPATVLTERPWPLPSPRQDGGSGEGGGPR